MRSKTPGLRLFLSIPAGYGNFLICIHTAGVAGSISVSPTTRNPWALFTVQGRVTGTCARAGCGVPACRRRLKSMGEVGLFRWAASTIPTPKIRPEGDSPTAPTPNRRTILGVAAVAVAAFAAIFFATGQSTPPTDTTVPQAFPPVTASTLPTPPTRTLHRNHHHVLL